MRAREAAELRDTIAGLYPELVVEDDSYSHAEHEVSVYTQEYQLIGQIADTLCAEAMLITAIRRYEERIKYDKLIESIAPIKSSPDRVAVFITHMLLHHSYACTGTMEELTHYLFPYKEAHHYRCSVCHTNIHIMSPYGVLYGSCIQIRQWEDKRT